MEGSTESQFIAWMRGVVSKSLENPRHGTGHPPLIYKRKGSIAIKYDHDESDVPTWHDIRQRSSDPFLKSASAVFSKLKSVDSTSPQKSGSTAQSNALQTGTAKGVSKWGKNQVSGKPFTSRFRGVHRTIPTKRWEAQFRKDGKPTSLGCFDTEESAARAYDRMMLWCELHLRNGGKPCVTNLDPEEYKKDLVWLQSISQDELLQELRREGREEAASRLDKGRKRESPPARKYARPS